MIYKSRHCRHELCAIVHRVKRNGGEGGWMGIVDDGLLATGLRFLFTEAGQRSSVYACLTHLAIDYDVFLCSFTEADTIVGNTKTKRKLSGIHMTQFPPEMSNSSHEAVARFELICEHHREKTQHAQNAQRTSAVIQSAEELEILYRLNAHRKDGMLMSRNCQGPSLRLQAEALASWLAAH